MKPIQPFTIWINGQTYIAHFLSAISTNDNLKDTAQFYYTLNGENGGEPSETIVTGNLTMNGQSYIDWNANPDINNDAYNWIADQLGLTLI